MSVLDLKNKIRNCSKLVVIGVGNEMKADDGAGVYIAKQLQEKVKRPDIDVFIGGATPENLTGPVKKASPSHIIIVDAADFGEKPGRLKFLEKDQIEGEGFSTHSFPLSVLVDYLERETGAKVLILGIQAKNTSAANGPSLEVKKAAQSLIDVLSSMPVE